jgi:hypothetical protein
LLIVVFAPIVSYAQTEFETYNDPYFGITIQRPADWYVEGDNPWNHADINPWHLPLMPVKELQPTAADILTEGKKTLIASVEPADESGAYMQLSVERMPLGTTLNGYIDHTLVRLKSNNDNLQVNEISETTLDGNPAARLVVTTGSADAFKTVQVISLYGNLAYILQYGAAIEGYDANLPAFQHLAESADINPPKSYAQVLLFSMAGTGAALAAIIAVKARRKGSYTYLFLRETKRMLAPALGIEVLCVASAEIGGLIGLYYFGFNPFGITMAYVLAYAFAGFTTFASILGRSSDAHSHEEEEIMCGCSSGHDSGFRSNFVQTFANFAAGLSKVAKLYREPNAWKILKASLIVLVSAESGCIIAAATVDVMLYQYSTFLSIPAALFAGTFTVASIAARRSLRRKFVEQPG